MDRRASKSWLITGCSTGFGRAVSEAALARGDHVLLTDLRVDALSGLAAAYPQTARICKLDVTQERDAAAAVETADAAFGGIDVLVNNAGICKVGSLEETAPEEYRPLFETNLFGTIAVTRAALPRMRLQGSGCIVNMSSVSGLLANPGMGYYAASKFAIEALSEALAAEVAPFGLRVLIVEPGFFRTNIGASLVYARNRIDAYKPTAHKTFEGARAGLAHGAGDPAKAAAAILQAVDAPEAPLRLPLGAGITDRFKARFAAIIRNLDECAATAANMGFDAES